MNVIPKSTVHSFHGLGFLITLHGLKNAEIEEYRKTRDGNI